MKTLFVLNPAAGHGRAPMRWDRALRCLSQPRVDVWTTTGPGDATRLTRKALEQGYKTIVAVGGDGTIGEAADGLLSAPAPLRENAVLGTWPTGSGCDLARFLGLTADLEAMEILLSRRNIRRLDAGRAEYIGYDGKLRRKHFLSVAALGIAGEVALHIQSRGKRLGGKLSYMAESLAALVRARSRSVDCVIDGAREPSGRYHLIVLANTGMFGGGMRIAPGADAQDGKLDLVTVGDLSRWELFWRFPKIYTGSHIGLAGVTHRLLRSLETRSMETVHINIDGEAAGTLPASFSVLPGAVPFLCP